MRGALAFALVFVRTASAITIAMLLIGLLFQAYARGGPPELGSVFQVIQGVLLSTMAYLFTTQAVDRAEAEVMAEVKQRGLLESSVLSKADQAHLFGRELLRTRLILGKLAEDDAVRRRIEELERTTQEVDVE